MNNVQEMVDQHRAAFEYYKMRCPDLGLPADRQPTAAEWRDAAQKALLMGPDFRRWYDWTNKQAMEARA